MNRFFMNVLLFVLVIVIEFGKSMGATVLPILASLILLIYGLTFWRNNFWSCVEKKYTVLFLGGISLYTIGAIFNVLMYN